MLVGGLRRPCSGRDGDPDQDRLPPCPCRSVPGRHCAAGRVAGRDAVSGAIDAGAGSGRAWPPTPAGCSARSSANRRFGAAVLYGTAAYALIAGHDRRAAGDDWLHGFTADESTLGIQWHVLAMFGLEFFHRQP